MVQYFVLKGLHQLLLQHLKSFVVLFVTVPGLLFGLQAIQLNLLPATFKEPIKSTIPLVAKRKDSPERLQAAALQKLIKEYTNSEQANFYIYIKDLSNGVSATLNDTKSVPSGSIYKLFVAHEAYRRQEAGEFSFSAPAGNTGYSVGQCVVLMVRNSTNICGESVRAMLGAARLDQDLHAQGYVGVDFSGHEAAQVSAGDIGLLYERLLAEEILSPAHRAEFVQNLKDQQWTFRLPVGLPPEPVRAKVLDWGNKTGDVYDYANDSAIVWGESTTYIVVLLSNNWPEVFPYSSYSIRHFSGQLYNLLNNTGYLLSY